jgi:hypothetical protein
MPARARHRTCAPARPLAGALVLAILLGGTAPAPAGKVESWRVDSAEGFRAGTREGVVISDAGRVALSRRIDRTPKLEAAHVWDLARTADGAVYAATGDAGRVYRLDPGAAAWTVAHDAEDTQVLALAIAPDGTVHAGTGPSGQVVTLKGDAKPAVSRPDPGVQYIWDLALDAAGNLYAATGPTGQLWRRTPAGAWSLVLDAKATHLLCVAVGPDGSVYAGSDGAGLVYRIGPDGKAAVLYDAPQNEVRALAITPDGTVFAGTSAAEGGGSGGGAGRGTTARGADARHGDDAIPASLEANLAMPRMGDPARLVRPVLAQAPPAPGGTAAPKPPAPGENAVYRITPQGAARQVFRAKALIFALAHRDGRLLIGTGPEGLLHELSDDARESTPLARLDNGQVLALLATDAGETLIGTGDPGAVARLANARVESGTITSDVLDAKYPSRFGAFAWEGTAPPATAVLVQVRTGNVGEPDATWSEWSEPTGDPTKVKAPPGRFAQWRARLTSGDDAQTPALRAVTWRYQTLNLPPEIARIDVPDLAAGDGATRQTSLALEWDASDPNGDDLEYAVEVRKDGWPDWIRLGDEPPLTKKSYTWDTTALPAGVYRVRVTASDRLANPADAAQERSLTSEPFVVDHQPPTVELAVAAPLARATLRDGFTRLVKAAYSLDGGPWIPVFPEDALFDATTEVLAIRLGDLKPGTHVLTVRTTDAAGNPGAADAVFTAK